MRDEKTALSLCHGCPKLCRFSCPVADADQNESTTPWGKMSTMKMVDEGDLPRTAETMALAYKCLNCRLSEEVCELDNPVSPVLDTHRMVAFKAGIAPERVYSFCRRYEKFDNPYGRDLVADLKRSYPSYLSTDNGAVYFPGCTETVQSPRTIGSAFTLFERYEIENISLFADPIQCCGYPLFVAGDWDNFREIAEVMANVLRNYSLVVSGAPICLHTMRSLYAAAGFPVRTRLVHTTELLADVLPTPSLNRGARRSVAYHDPCYLGRYRQTYEEPRRLIEAATGHPPVEFFRNRELSYCCGGGGLVPISFPETADRITRNRLDEFRRTGARTLVTACPVCVERFKGQITPSRVMNITDYIAKS